MEFLIQKIKGFRSKIKPKVTNVVCRYIKGLMLTKEHRNCSNIARYLHCSRDKIYEFLRLPQSALSSLSTIPLKLASELAKENCWGYFIIDDSSLAKIFSCVIAKVCYGFNSVLNRPINGINIVVIAWTNGIITIPIAFKFWVNRKNAEENYKTKPELAKEIINEICDKISVNYFLLDGLYCSDHMMRFFDQKNIKFIMRFPRNRCIETHDGQRFQIQKHKHLKLKRNERNKTVHAEYKGKNYFFTIEKRKNKHGKYQTVFLVSNVKLASREYIEIYKIRWKIEKCFRTIKQSLGADECQAQSANKQSAHIYATFISYAFAQLINGDKSNKPPEAIFDRLRWQKSHFPDEELRVLIESFC